MTIYYLYVKQHKITGLKYLGQTSRDPYVYKGSGVYWLRHLNKHGSDHTTEILFETKNKEELKLKGTYYSELWDVVRDRAWANLKPEYGNGGAWNKGLKLEGEKYKKGGRKQKGNKTRLGAIIPIAQRNKQSNTMKRKYLEGSLVPHNKGKKTTEIVCCLNCKREISGLANFSRWHGLNCRE
jgi:hypothetical protein